MIELTFLKELMLIIQAYQKSVIFAIICIFLDKGLKSRPDFCNWYYDVLMMSMNLAISLF